MFLFSFTWPDKLITVKLYGLQQDFSAATSGCLGNMTQTNTVTIQLILFPGGFALALSKQRPLSYENIKKVYALRKSTM